MDRAIHLAEGLSDPQVAVVRRGAGPGCDHHMHAWQGNQIVLGNGGVGQCHQPFLGPEVITQGAAMGNDCAGAQDGQDQNEVLPDLPRRIRLEVG
ncbi:hypothetical protein C4900_07280 [Acidiferrobacter thiooxydans]|uniref:Uncharacterized protein n=1 Tax=Acidiferrobacter thiooxydans TaxID=163359 RepID=A0A368HDX3_9GAMM|nr:hypothetical protein C4900_07280 [Acidiferrobacter thiooxydans]